MDVSVARPPMPTDRARDRAIRARCERVTVALLIQKIDQDSAPIFPTISHHGSFQRILALF
jgi:hypothetical protein